MPADVAKALVDHRCVAVGLGQADQLQRIGDFALPAVARLDPRGQVIALAHDLLRGGRVAPQIGVFGLSVQLRKPGLGDIPVKDASSAAPPTA